MLLMVISHAAIEGAPVFCYLTTRPRSPGWGTLVVITVGHFVSGSEQALILVFVLWSACRIGAIVS
jgi:hypothetical protein